VDAYANFQPGEEVEIVLRSAVRLYGRVLESDGTTPVADALVVSPGKVADETCRTSADGSYEFPAREGGTRCRLEVFRAGRTPAKLELLLPAHGETRRDVVLAASANFTGRVVDAESWKPIPNATIYGGRSAQQVATADAEGRFQIEVEAAMLMRERNQSISIEKPGASPTGAYLGDDLRAEAPGYTPTGAPLWVPVQDSELDGAS
jgi:hypothetical protein